MAVWMFGKEEQVLPYQVLLQILGLQTDGVPTVLLLVQVNTE
jgi:hypothetical protein